MRIYRIWHGHVGSWNTIFLDKKMNANNLSKETLLNLITDYKETIEEQAEKLADQKTTITFLQEEISQLRGQINDLLH